MNAPIRVLLADDQTLVRRGIRSLLALADGLEVVGESSDGHETLDAIAAQRPDVVLLDLRMPGLTESVCSGRWWTARFNRLSSC